MKLTLRDRIVLDVPRERVRDWLANPENWPGINDKIEMIRASGDRCEGILRFRGRVFSFEGPVAVTDRPLEISAHITLRPQQDDPTPGQMDVSYRIDPRGSGCRVTETVTFHQAVPIWAWLLVKLITTFGRPVDGSNLQRLAAILAADSPVSRTVPGSP